MLPSAIAPSSIESRVVQVNPTTPSWSVIATPTGFSLSRELVNATTVKEIEKMDANQSRLSHRCQVVTDLPTGPESFIGNPAINFSYKLVQYEPEKWQKLGKRS